MFSQEYFDNQERDAFENLGPSINLYSRSGDQKSNTINKFMYIVPTISPVLATNIASLRNTQKMSFTSCETSRKGSSFSGLCEFSVFGAGTNTNEFDVKLMVRRNMDKEKCGVIANMLDKIEITGGGRGSIGFEGVYVNGEYQINRFKIKFSGRGRPSPVKITLYDAILDSRKNFKRKNNIKTEIIASLEFSRPLEGKVPRMKINIEAAKGSGWKGWGRSLIANHFFIPPISVNPIGNNAVLELALALYENDLTFTFPKAVNLKELD